MGKKIIRLTTFFVLFLSIIAFSQNHETNLEKYWRYKDRLRQNFVAVSSDVERPGVNIPAVDLSLDANCNKINLGWGDGNSNISHYLSLLATEYRLLKNNNQNYKETLKELYYALMAFERLDQYSEYYIRYRENIGYTFGGNWFRGFVANPSDVNGWMIRDDVSTGFWATFYPHFGFSNNYVTSFTSVFKDGSMESVSQDNIYHLLEGIALIRKLVENEYVGDIPCNFINDYIPNRLSSEGIINNGYCNFSLWAKSITTRVIKMMQNDSQLTYVLFPSITLAKTNWFILNPVTNTLAEEGSGSDFDLFFFCSYGLAKAGQWITGQDIFQFDHSDDNLHRTIFYSLLQGHVSDAFDLIDIRLPHKYDPYHIQSLATIGDIDGTNTYNLLRNRNFTYKNKNGVNIVCPYEHFQLIYLALHGDEHTGCNVPGTSEYNTDLAYYENLLNIAPCNGPRSYNKILGGSDYSGQWSSTSRLVWPENLSPTDPAKVEFSGMDYMLLHNLYCLAFSKDFRKLTVSIDNVYNNQNTSETGVDIIASNQISGGNITFSATNSIKLIAGFKITNNAVFSAKIISSQINYKGYSQFNTCPLPDIYITHNII